MYTLVTIVDSVEDETCQTRLVGSPDLPMVVVTELMEWTLMKHLNLAGRESLYLLGWQCDPTPEWHNSPIPEEQCWTLNWERVKDEAPGPSKSTEDEWHKVEFLDGGRWQVSRPVGTRGSYEVLGYLAQGLTGAWHATRFDGKNLLINGHTEYAGNYRPGWVAKLVQWEDNYSQ